MNPNEMASGLLRMDWITQIFWTIDMLMSLLTGYVHEGEGPYLRCSGPTGVVITKPSMILKNYLSLGSKLQQGRIPWKLRKTWFILDLTLGKTHRVSIYKV